MGGTRVATQVPSQALVVEQCHDRLVIVTARQIPDAADEAVGMAPSN
jgi:hypothetical protein